MFWFPRDTFTTSDGYTFIVHFARVENPFAFWWHKEAQRIIKRDLFVVKGVFFFEVAVLILTVICALMEIEK